MRLILQTKTCCRLEKDLVAIAKLIDIQEQTDQVDNEIAAYVLESAFKLAVRPNDPRTTSRPLNSLLERFFVHGNVSSTRARGLYSVVQNLPANQLHGCWTAVLLLRALIMND